jgi:hypothetical protein
MDGTMDELNRDELRELLLDAAPSDATREAMFAHTFSDGTAGAGAELLPSDGWYEADPYGYDDPDIFSSPEIDSADDGDFSDSSGAGYDALAEAGTADVDALHDSSFAGEGSHDSSGDVSHDPTHGDTEVHDHGDTAGGGDDFLFDTGHGGW